MKWIGSGVKLTRALADYGNQNNTNIYPRKPSWRRKPNKTSSIYMYQKYKDKTPNMCSFSLQICLYLSYALYTSECGCSNEEHTSSIYTLFLPLDFFPNKLTSTNLLGRLHLGRHKPIQYYILEGSIDPAYNEGFTSWLYDDQIQ